MISPRTFSFPPGTPRLLRELATYVSDLARDWTGFVFADGVLVEDLTFTALGNLVVEHQLGRLPRGYLIVTPSAGGMPYVSAANWAARTSKHITLTGAGNMTCSLWFF